MDQAVLLPTVDKETRSIQASVCQIPLAMVNSGEQVRVIAIRGKDEVQRFLRNLGFVENAAVSVVSELNGNVIVNVKGTRVAISRAMANRILTA